MTEDLRPNPDVLLASIHRSEAKEKRGRMKVFFGMAPGVGKTYAMLQAAQNLNNAGFNLLIGVVETHGREETKRLLEGLPILPRKKIDYHGSQVEEMDLEALLARAPRLAIVDELAHTNVPGSRHLKRWQDVEELLSSGIDVFTTLNVQHLESRADTVFQITGVAVRETVPDSMIEAANDIQLIDVTPGQLRARLTEGRVYIGDRAAIAADHFFKESNLTALRGLALRITAERVDKQLREIRDDRNVSTIWKSGERLLVAVSPSPFSTRLIRWTRRMAYALDAPWIAVNVESNRALTREEQRLLDTNLALARELNAEVVVLPGEDIAATLVRVAQQHNVSQIVVGKPRGSSLLEFFRGGSLVDHLLRRSGQIDIYVVPAEPRTGRDRWKDWNVSIGSQPKEYATAIVTVLAVTLFGLVTKNWMGYWSVSLFYLSAVAVLGLFVGQGPLFCAATLSAVTWNFLFIPPVFTFQIYKLEDALMFGFFFILALVTGRLTGRLRAQASTERSREQRATALYRLTRAIASARSADEVIRNARAQIQEIFGCRMAVFTPDESGRLQLHPAATYMANDKEQSVAAWVFRNKKVAGRSTDTLPSSEGFYLPLVAGDTSLGVVGLKPPVETALLLSQRELLETFSTQIALALDRERLRATEETARLSQESDKLHRTLLDSVSHELKTPLAVIASAAENLTLTVAAKSLVSEIQTAVQRLQRLVNNLLDMTRLESGSLRPRLDWTDINDLVNAAVEATREAWQGRIVHSQLPAGLPFVRLDFALIEQALVNLIHNACHYTPPNAEITISAGLLETKKEIWISVSDTGPGLQDDQKARVFEKFFRGQPEKAGGLGLGLSIVRGFVEVHGGHVTVKNLPSAGACFTIVLPFNQHGSVPDE